MKVLKRRDKLDKTITIRVPEATKTGLDQLRQRADAAGFDFGATLRESLVVVIRQISTELEGIERKKQVQSVDILITGADHTETTSGKASAV
jgi:hypothetical protein